MKNDKCSYEHEKNCECREDNNCGCSYPNNMRDDIMCGNVHIKENSSEVSDKAENIHHFASDTEIYVCPVCGQSAKDCACHKNDL
mgnify:CR=1 FL=1